MRKTILSLLAIVIGVSSSIGLFALHPSGPWKKTKPSLPQYREGEVLVQYARRARSNTNQQHFTARHGLRHVRTLNSEGLTHMRLRPGKKVEEAVRELAQDPDVELVQPNYIYRATATTPNDTSYGSLWALKNTAQTVGTGTYTTNNPGTANKDISAEAAWDLITDCSSITVAVIDTGVNYDHNDLSANMWDGGVTYPNHGYDFVDGDDDPMDLNGHGTHVAGIVGAVGNNATGSTGVCWTSSLMAIRVLDATGSGATSDVVSGVNFAVAQGAKVINMSLGGGSYDAALNTAILAASNSGSVIVVAAGNDGTNNDQSGNQQYPCNLTAANLVCVAALDQSYGKASFSNYGRTSVDVGAPGTNSLSTWHGTETVTTDDFTAGWTTNDGVWTDNVVNLSGTNYDMLTNPANWSSFTTGYANSADNRAYKQFNLAGADVAIMNFYAFIDTQASTDYFKVAFRNTAGDPFAAGTTLAQLSGSTGGSAESFSYNLENCLTATCNVGFQLTSNATTVDDGVGILEFDITTTVLNNTSYETINGTSMATPYVAGIAAMVFAYNPSYTAADVVKSVKLGGTAASSITMTTNTGKAANAYGSLTYIAPPTGGAAQVQ